MAYERTLNINSTRQSNLGDGSLQIPERANGVPDFLDEARWEMSFMLKMQIPPNSPPQLINGALLGMSRLPPTVSIAHPRIDVSGMVHHKMHDNQWTALPTLPSNDPKRRELHRPSTAATLNMAGTAAMSARLWAPYDSAFSEQCLTAARTAYEAAKVNPSIYAPGSDGDLGGGAYSDNDATDEFYFAAVELYLTTKEDVYAQDLQGSTYFTAMSSKLFPRAGFSWNFLASLGQLDLATVPNNLPARRDIIDTIVSGAEQYVSVQHGQPTGVMLTSYSWGSNSKSRLRNGNGT